MKSRLSWFAFLALFIVMFAGWLRAQEGDTPGAASAPAATAASPSLESGALSIGPERVYNLLRRGDPSMWGLVLCSIITVTFVLERLIVLRSRRVIPRTFVDRFMDRLRDGDLERGKARDLCRDNGSSIANLFALAVSHSGQPAAEIREAVSEGAQTELFHLRRRVRALNGIVTVAPLLGLFGTVIGMIDAFHALSMQTGGGKTELLAHGISLALVATATGLCIAIIAAAAYYFLLGRIDRLVQQMDELVNDVIEHIAAPRPPDKPVTRPRVVPSREQASV